MAADTLLPDADVSTGLSTTVPSTPTTHYTKIDEGTASPSDADYNETTTDTQADEFSFGNTAANHNLTSAIDLQFRCALTDASNAANWVVDLTHSGGTAVTGSPKTITCVTSSPGATEVLNDGTPKTVTLSFTGLSLNKTQMDSLQCKYTFHTS